MMAQKTMELTETEELYRISNATNNDGTVDVEILDWNKMSNQSVDVLFVTPSGDVEVERMEWPKKDCRKYKFVRLMNQLGYGIIGADAARDSYDTVKANQSGDNWELHVPIPPPSKRTRLKRWLLNKYSYTFSEEPQETSYAGFPFVVGFFPIIVIASILDLLGNNHLSLEARYIVFGVWATLIWLSGIAMIILSTTV